MPRLFLCIENRKIPNVGRRPRRPLNHNGIVPDP